MTRLSLDHVSAGALIAAALALAGVAAHATTVSDLQIPFVGGLN